jgi:NADP-dependent 3-hydroxy acid dehydrogenase YdfG
VEASLSPYPGENDMLKVFAFLTKKEGMETQAFVDYYENHHVPLISSLAPPPPVYKRNYLKRGDEFNREDGTIGFDVVTEQVFPDRPAFLAWLAKVSGLLDRGYNVVANSRNITKSRAFEASDTLALVDGSIAEAATAAKVAGVAKSKFGSIDALINNAGIYFTKHFTDYTVEDLRSLVSVNIEGFLFISQLAIKQMLAQKTGGSIVNVTATLVDHPIAGINSAVPMITKGGLEAVTRSLAMEYAKQGIRVNAVAPGVVDTPMHRRAQ